MPITVREINTYSKITEIKHVWNEFRKTIGESNVYTHPDWIYAWKFLPKTGEPVILIALDKETMIGIALLQIKTYKHHGITLRKIEFICDSPLNDFLIKDRHEEVISEFINHLCNKRKSWDILELSRLNQTSSNLDYIRTIFKYFNFKLYETDSYPNGICVVDDWDSYLNRRSRNFRKRARQTKNRLDKLGNISIKRYCGLEDKFTDAQSLEKLKILFQDAIACAKNSWQAKVREGTSISDKDAYDFFKEIIYSFASMDKLLLHVMYSDKKAIAYNLAFFEEHKVMNYKTAFDEEYKYYRPGAHLFNTVLKDASEKELYNVDLMSIEKNGEYKYKFIDKIYKTKTITIFNKNFKGLFIRIIVKDIFHKVK